jgi:hypothetical protein
MAVNGRSRDRDEILVAALAAGMSYREAGAKAGLSERTVRRRMSESAFRERVAEQGQEYAEQVRGLLLNGGPAAANTVAKLAIGAESESVRLGAARVLLGHVAGRQGSFFDESISDRDVVMLLNKVIETALRFVPDEYAEVFVREVGALGRRT